MKTKTELLAQLDRVTAERDAALAELKRYQSLFNQAQRAIDRLNELHPKRMAELGRRLTAADERNDEAIDLLRRARAVIEGGGWADLERDIAIFFKPAEGKSPLISPESERLMEIVQQYPNVDPLEYDAAVRTLRK